jgi:hypothetical protein
MIFDRELCFIHQGAITGFTTGTVGSALDLGAPGQTGKGRVSYVAIACNANMTATGSPTINLSLEFSEDDTFTSPMEIPLSLPVMGKGDFAKGNVIGALAPLLSLRWVRLKMTTSAALACTSMTAGFVLDLQTNE